MIHHLIKHHQIIESCGATRLGHFGRSQFYVALKMVAAAQAGYPLTPDTFKSSTHFDIPLPKFLSHQMTSDAPVDTNTISTVSSDNSLSVKTSPVKQKHHSGPDSIGTSGNAAGATPAQLPPPPSLRSKKRTNHNNNGGGFKGVSSYERGAPSSISSSPEQSMIHPITSCDDPHNLHIISSSEGDLIQAMVNQHSTSTPLKPVFHRNYHNRNGGRGTRRLQPTSVSSSPEAGVSPNSLVEQGWQSFDADDDVNLDKWTAIEEGQRLIGDEENDEDDDEDNNLLKDPEEDEEENDDPEEDEEDEEDNHMIESSSDIWHVTTDQKDYYSKQFYALKRVQPKGTSGLNQVSGTVAKGFFEKSRLPTVELSSIWKLADVDHDGSLTLGEFVVAMHLVVLRRNGVDLPPVLPPNLLTIATSTPPEGKPSVTTAVKTSQKTSSQLSAEPLRPVRKVSLDSQREAMLHAAHHHNLSSTYHDTSNSDKNRWTIFSSESPTTRNNNNHKLSHQISSDGLQSSSSSSSNATSTNATIIPDVKLSGGGFSPSDFSSSSNDVGPVNFNFSSSHLERDPKILHPVALRLTPEGQCLLKNLNENISPLIPTTITGISKK